MSGALTAEGLAVQRGGVPVLEGVDLSVKPGEALVLRGPNGIGKTSLLRTLALIEPQLAGRLDGAVDRVSLSGHADAIKPALSVMENLSFWAGIHGTRDIDRALKAFQIADLSRRPAQSLSAGQKRRLGLARMLVTGRPIWLMDEPTVSLDKDAVALFAEVVRGHLAQGGLAVIATHVHLGLVARELDLTPFRARAPEVESFL